MLFAVLAQADPSSLVGGAGWAGVGLLGSVLSWLLFIHLPAKDKLVKELVEAKDAQIKDMLDTRDALVLSLAKIGTDNDRERRQDFKESLKTMVDGFVVEIRELRRVIETVSDASRGERSLEHLRGLQTEAKAAGGGKP